MQKNLHLKINLLNISEKNWMGTKICQRKHLKSPQWLRNIKTKQKKFWKFYKPKEPQLIIEGGWHFNDLKNAQGILKKIKSFAHQEYNKDEFTDEKKILKRIRENKDIFDRKFEYKKIELDESFPKYILNNKNLFREWII